MTPLPVDLAASFHWSVESTSGRYGATVLVGLVLGLAAGTIYYGGRLLKRRYDDDLVEAVQSTTMIVVALGLGGLLVAVWRVDEEVLEALGFVVVTPVTFVKVLVTFAALAGAYTVTRLTKRSIRYGMRDATSAHQREVAHHVVQFLVFVPATLFVVGLWGVPFRDLFFGAGVLGIVLGFAARQTLSGVLSGFVILFARPFEVGDWIAVEDREGIVTDITVYNTQIRTFDEEHVLVPNDEVTRNQVVNYSKTDRLRITTEVGVDYDCDVGEAAAIAVEAMEDCEELARTPPPDVVRDRFGDSAVVLRLRYWIDTPSIRQKWRAQNEVIEGVKSAFEAEGIKIPFPQRELGGREETGGLRVAATEVEPAGAAEEHRIETPDGADGTSDGAAGDGSNGRTGETADETTDETADDGQRGSSE